MCCAVLRCAAQCCVVLLLSMLLPASAHTRAHCAAQIDPKAEAVALIKLVLFVPIYAPLWIYRRFERDGKLVLLAGLCALALGAILAGILLRAGAGSMVDASGALGMVGIGLILLAAHFSS